MAYASIYLLTNGVGMVLEFGEPGPIAGYHILLIIRGEKLLHFSWITLQLQKYFGKLLYVYTMKSCKIW